jgi:glycosyltransferase involved in cell wall biosynthesis
VKLVGVALTVGVGIGCAYWLLVLALTLVTIRRVGVLADLAPPQPARWPRLSIVIPARDEADTLERAMAGKLAQTGPELELVLVDDRSTDGTSAIVDRIAAADPRVQAIHVTALPDGWLGKVHALQRGLEASTGELVLFTDADVEFEPGSCARAVALMEGSSLDHLTVLPSSAGRLLHRRRRDRGAPRDVRGRAGLAGRRSEVIRVRRLRRVQLVRRAALDRTPASSGCA